MKTERINGYLYLVVDSSTKLDFGVQEEEQSAEEYLAAKGISPEEIKKLIIEAE